MERPIRYVRESFFYGRQPANDAGLTIQLEQWLQQVTDVRVQATTGEPQIERFERDERGLKRHAPELAAGLSG